MFATSPLHYYNSYTANTDTRVENKTNAKKLKAFERRIFVFCSIIFLTKNNFVCLFSNTAAQLKRGEGLHLLPSKLSAR